MPNEFRDFINRGNVVELAVAFVLGVAFQPDRHDHRRPRRDATDRAGRRQARLRQAEPDEVTLLREIRDLLATPST